MPFMHSPCQNGHRLVTESFDVAEKIWQNPLEIVWSYTSGCHISDHKNPVAASRLAKKF